MTNTTDLIERRDLLTEDVINDFNDTFEADIYDLDEMISYEPEEDDDHYEDYEDEFNTFRDAWADELQEIRNIDEIESDIGSREFQYGITLIPVDDFEEYVQDYVRELYNMSDIPSWIEIDWDATAHNLSSDFSSVEYDGDSYYYQP